MTLRLFLFGSPTAEQGARSVALPFERRSQLLVFLALKRAWVGRSELAALLWPDQAQPLAYANLRKTLFRLQAWPWGSQVEVEGGALRLIADTDVFGFESGAQVEPARGLLSARRGELLAGFEDDGNEAWSAWLGFERDRLRVAWRSAALTRLGSEIDPGEAIDLSARLLELDPLDEAALHAHLSWLARDGQRSRAREAYRAFAGRLAQDLGIAPGSSISALHESISTVSPAVPSPAPSSGTGAPDGFVGRTAELKQIAALLAQDTCRLVTLVGPGGMGKTRLAQRAMLELAPGYADGMLFVPLEDVAAAGEIGGRLARELELRVTGSGEPLAQVIEHLRTRQMLVVLDNFEQLVGEASLVQRLLDKCARLAIIVTTRVRLALASEWLLPLEGLPCPEPEDHDRIEAFDASRLFVQAARRVEPALTPAAEAAAIVDICRQVEGLPLALELAAAWARVLPCSSIAAELRRGTELLRATDAAHPPRHASMEVVFEQSWHHLSPVEREALSRLSVFRGGFTAEAARAAAGTSLPVLGALADRSLLRKDALRLSLHPLVQRLAGLRLDEGALRESTERAHALYFHRTLAQLRRGVEEGDRSALQWVEVEFENCRIAWRYARSHGANEVAARSVPTLRSYCDHSGRFEEALALFRDMLDAPAVGQDSEQQARLIACTALFEYRLDRFADAEATATRALALADASHDHDTRLQCFKVLGTCSLRLGRHRDAKRHFMRALKEAPAGINPRNAAAMLDNLALVEKAAGRPAEARRLSLRALAENRRLGHVAGEALCLNNLGALHLDRGDHEAAAAYLNEGLALCDRHGLVTTRGLILANLTGIAILTGDLEAAGTLGSRALEVAEAAGNRSVVCWLKLQLVSVSLRRGEVDAARADLSRGMSLAIAIGRPSLQFAGVCRFAELLATAGDIASAQRLLAYVMSHPRVDGPERDDAQRQLANLPAPESSAAGRLGIDLEELAHRIVAEADRAHVPLIAAIRAASPR